MAGRSKKVIRTVRVARVADFDDQLWPINCAILILAGFVAGVAIATGDFHADDLLHNTVVRLAAIAVGVAALFWAVFRLQGKMRRRVQFCVLISLLVHLWLAMILHEQYITVLARMQSESNPRAIEQAEPETVPDYDWETIERPESRRSFEKPVEADVSKETDPEPVRQKEIEHEVPLRAKPTAEPAAPQRQQPSPAEIRRAELTAPRRALQAAGAQISRQPQKHRLEPNEPIAEPQTTARAEQALSTPGAKVAALERRKPAAPALQRRSADVEPRAVARRNVTRTAQLPAAAARRATASEPQPSETEFVLSRPSTLARSPSGASMPSAAVANPSETPAAAGGSPSSRLEATETAVARSTTRAPSGRSTAAAGTAAFAVGSTRIDTRRGQPRATGAERPSIEPNSTLPRIARSRARQTSPTAAAPTTIAGPATEFSDRRRRLLSPTKALSVVGRRQESPPTVVGRRPVSNKSASADSGGAAGRIGVAQLARVTRHESIPRGLSGSGIAGPARAPSRAPAPKVTTGSPQVGPTGSAGGTATGSPPAAMRSPLAARINGGRQHRLAGLPGGLRSRSLAGAPAALAGQGVPLSDAVARRAAASQREPGGAGPSPADGVTMARTRTGRSLPAAAVGLDDLPTAGLGGVVADSVVDDVGRLPSRLEAGSTAGARQTPGTAPIGRETVAAGNAEFGVGSAPLATMTGKLRTGRESVPTVADDGSAAWVAGAKRSDAPEPNLLGHRFALPQSPGADAPPEPADKEGNLGDAVGETAGRRVAGGLPVRIAALEGPGGLGYDPSPEVGVPSRRARPESDIVHTVTSRFLVQRSGGRLAVDGRVHETPTEAFRRRDPGRRARTVREFGGTEGTERAVEMGLDFFVRCQFPDGRWSLDKLPKSGKGYEDAALGKMQSDTAATGMALLAFLGAGYTHQADKHRDTVRRGLDWLVANQKPDGDLFTGGTNCTWFYSHGIATIALCEAYGMTRDPDLREPAQKAVRFIVESQHPTRGGWRYKPRVESDTSVSGWQLMALKSAQMAELEVPGRTLQKVSDWLDHAQKKDGGRYVYNPHAEEIAEQREGRAPNLAMTAEGALMRMYLGWNRDNPAMVDVAEYLHANLPDAGTRRRPVRNVYYWYYATQVMFHMQGEYWDAWNDRLQPLLENSQRQEGPLAGSWHPLRPIPDRWGQAGGRVYVTAMNLLMLEVYYRHLPLFQTIGE